MSGGDDQLWYKDAIVYQTHVKAFFDSNNDGIGDIEGVIQKLDYIQDLGVSVLWLLPFYPSPLRDDGYDIADYRNINTSYGNMQDVKRLIHEAHRRGLRVITELVINHTSDQHPWFQRARRAKKGSRHRDYYVWSDTDQKYQDTRIIFIDTEKSNWTWDPEAQAYFWHRFYSHQPDLNFDNPAVMREVKSLLHYWLKMGIDGLRLDAIPYLIEREGTSSENLPETHAILKELRAEMQTHFPGTMLLAEANQWPEDTRPYFGEGDECQMAFHFPLMPRMYMAIAQEDRLPITDIMRQTPDIPENCQWAIFLRNHDELTLEMVTESERDYLWNTYAADRRMRLNLGIRRRLAPLMENDRRKIELMDGLLFSMPGTPVVYYGDEIGMGDNIYLGDRDGVRTPMQWSPDRNAGFSRAAPQRLFLPPVMDPIYGYEAVNVEAQQQSPGSLLNWMKRIIAVRQAHRAFGRGTQTFVYPRNRKILAYLRELEDETLLCVFNLSRNAQAVELDLSRFTGMVPVELLGRTAFPPIADAPYPLAMPGYGFYWFVLSREADVPTWHIATPDPLPELITIVFQTGWRNIAEGAGGRDLAQQSLPGFLANQRWFAAKDHRISGVRLAFSALLPGDGEGYLVTEIEVSLAGAEPQLYLLPLSIAWGEQNLAPGAALLPYTVAKVRRGSKMGALHDALAADDFARAVVRRLRQATGDSVSSDGLRFHAGPALAEVELTDELVVRRLGVEQSNSSVLIDDRVMLKIYRRLQPGIHPEIEVGRFLTEVAGFANTPPLLGTIEHVQEDGTSTALASATGFVANQGDGWRFTLDYLDRELDEMRVMPASDEPRSAEDVHESYLPLARLLGQRTAEMHKAFAVDTDDPAFAREPIEEADLVAWAERATTEGEHAFATLERALGDLREEDRALAEAILGERQAILEEIRQLARGPIDAAKTRLHGDYHLGQVLAAVGDFMIIDFEGEPRRSVEERRRKASPLRDVAGMLRSFDYAGWASLMRFAESDPGAAESLLPAALAWRDTAIEAFLEGYRGTIVDCPSYPQEPAQAERLLRLFLIEKVLYEIGYEAANRPLWLRIPVRGLAGLFNMVERLQEPHDESD